MRQTTRGTGGRTEPMSAGARLRRLWAPAVAFLVAASLLALVTVGVLSLAQTLDRGRRAQIAIAEISHLVDVVRFQPTLHPSGSPISDAELAANADYRERLLQEATTLNELTHLGLPILHAVNVLNRAVESEVQALQDGNLRQAAYIDETIVTDAYLEFGADTLVGVGPGGDPRPSLWVSTSASLDRDVQAANRDITRTMVGEIVGVGLLIITVMTVGGFVRRRGALEKAQEAAEWDAAEHQAALLRNSSDLILVSDLDGRLTYASPSAESMLGVGAEAIVGQPARDLVHEDDQQVLAECLRLFQDREHDSLIRQLRLRHGDGSYRVVEACFTNLVDDPVVRGVVANVRDITDRFRLEAELRHAQKLESVGQLASGIAHEINTPIQFIGDNVRFLGDAFGELLGESQEEAVAMEREYLAEEVPVAIAQTLDGVDRVAAIVRAMKAFGHPGSEEKTATDVNEAVRNTLIVANNTVKHVADVVTDLGDLPRVWCHPGDLNQVLVNLVVNAAHAIADSADGGRGTITVRTFQNGVDAVIEVHDTGCGIPDDVAAHVFEPFFTTKEVGRGTGQGLALAYALITERHDGLISFAARPEGGTVFAVRVPVGGAEAERGRESLHVVGASA